MDVDLVGQIASQGFGYILFLGTLFILHRREQEWSKKLDGKDEIITELANKRTSDLERIKDADFQVFEQMRALDEEKTNKQNELINRMLYILENVQKFLERK